MATIYIKQQIYLLDLFVFQAQELTGVAVPKYYNPAAVNPLKYAEQVQKRKLLWGKKDKDKPVEVSAWVKVFRLQTEFRHGNPVWDHSCDSCRTVEKSFGV